MFLGWLVVINCRANFFISPPAVRLLCFFSLSQLSCFSLTVLPLSLSFSVSVTTTASVCVCLLPRANMLLRGGWGGGGADGDLVMKSGGDGFLLLQPPESDSHSLPLLRLSLSQQLCGGERRLDGFSRKILSIHLFFLCQAFPLKNVYISLSIWYFNFIPSPPSHFLYKLPSKPTLFEAQLL